VLLCRTGHAAKGRLLLDRAEHHWDRAELLGPASVVHAEAVSACR
jgi:hypothetical protein